MNRSFSFESWQLTVTIFLAVVTSQFMHHDATYCSPSVDITAEIEIESRRRMLATRDSWALIVV